MLRLVDVSEWTTDHITFTTEEITAENLTMYVVYDTSTGVSVNSRDDYYAWRCFSVLTSTGSSTYKFTINNSTLYPSYTSPIADYTTLSPRLFCVMTYQEYATLSDVIIRLDLVRKRLPNPGIGIASTDGIGEDGNVAYTGGYEKKMMVSEVMRMVEGTIVELNGCSPRTFFWPVFYDKDADKINNPYLRSGVSYGMPQDMMQLVVLGTLLRCLISTGILEVDISFSTSDSGLQLTFDRASHIKGWHDTLLTEYKDMRYIFKMNHYSGPFGVGTIPYAAMGPFGTLFNNAMSGGTLSLNTVLGFTARGNIPM